MFTMDIRSNVADVLRRVEDRAKSIPVATSNALNTTIFKIKDLEVQEISRVFDRPTRFTLDALFVKRATAQQLSAHVFLKEGMGKQHYLRPQIYGGSRPLKGFEKMLRHAGMLPAGMYVVPGSAAKMDSNGNMSRGQLMQIMSALKLAERTAGYSANRTEGSVKRRRGRVPLFFVGRPGGGRLPLGVWQSFRFGVGTAVKPVLIFVRQPAYKKLFKFFELAERTAAKAFPLQLERELRGIPTGASLGLSR